MKRRTFLNTAGTIGVVGLTSSATLANSVYKDISSNQLLEEFDAPTRKAYEKFVFSISENIESVGVQSNLSITICMPTKIIEKTKNSITYKNRGGQTVSITMKNGVNQIRVS